MTQFPLLDRIHSPAELRLLSEPQLPQLAQELRQALLASVAQSGGHLAAGLGTVELTLALHYVYNTPDDALVWDVGHQAYPHKMLTGRRQQLLSIRQKDGVHPFPNRNESPFDAFGVGHSSTSISAALGMALAFQAQSSPNRVAAIIGDGALTAGMAFEALNHAGHTGTDLLVILNDNDMSISENVGALNSYLARLLSGSLYAQLRESGKKIVRHLPMPGVEQLARRAEEHLKGMVTQGTLFEELGFNYIGPIDGHHLPTLVKTLRNMRNLKGPQLLHVITRKGKGYAPAEADPIAYHGVGTFNPELDHLPAKAPTGPSYSNVFGRWLCDQAAQDSRLVGITPAMREGSDLIEFSKQFPERYFDVAIAEQHAVTLAAGLACQGMKPVVAIYSSFLQRAYDQLIHDVALQNLPVIFAVDRAGLVGGDGATHQGCFDLSFLRAVPNLLLMAPSDENQCRQMLHTAYLHEGPSAVRYPRGQGPGANIEQPLTALPIGKAEVRRPGQEIAILSFGALLQAAWPAADSLNATLVDMRFVKPLDTEMIRQLAQDHRLLVTLEENVLAGGAGSAVAEYLNQNGIHCAIRHLALPDQFIDHGDPKLWLADFGLDAAGILRQIQAWWADVRP